MDPAVRSATLSLSPDGRRLALTIEAANDQIWVYDLERSTLSPQTLRGNNNEAIWTPDGSRLDFSRRTAEGPSNLFWQPADGSGPAERLTTSAHWQTAQAWSPDGKTSSSRTGRRTGRTSGSCHRTATASPDRSFHGPSTSLSPGSPRTDAGSRMCRTNRVAKKSTWCRSRAPGAAGRSRRTVAAPLWARNGRELFYRNGDRTMAVTVTSDATFSATKPRSLFEAKALSDSFLSYDVTPEGDFLMIEPGESDTPPSQINVVLNWLQEVRHRVAGRVP